MRYRGILHRAFVPATVALLGAGVASSALGQQIWTKTFTPPNPTVDKNWYNPANWTAGGGSPAGIPNEFDRVIIPSGLECVIKGDLGGGVPAKADTIWVKGAVGSTPEAELRIVRADSGNSQLWLHDLQEGVSNPPSRVDGLLDLAYERAWLVIADNDHIIQGRGRIVGHAEASKVLVHSGLTLTCVLPLATGGVVGSMTIDCIDCASVGGTGNFHNWGRVEAKVLNNECLPNGAFNAGLIRITDWMDIDDSAAAEWRAVECGVLCIQSDPGGTTPYFMEGDFLIDKGTCANARISIDARITTAGALTLTAGELLVCSDTPFTFVGLTTPCPAQFPLCGPSTTCTIPPGGLLGYYSCGSPNPGVCGAICAPDCGS